MDIFSLKYNHKANLRRALEDTIRQGRPVARFMAGGRHIEIKEADKYLEQMSAGAFQQKAEATMEVLSRMPRHWAYGVYIYGCGRPSISVIYPEKDRLIQWARHNHLTYTVEKKYHRGDARLAPWWECQLNINAGNVRIGTWWSEE